MLIYRGIGVSSGIVIGTALLIEEKKIEAKKCFIENIEEEQNKLDFAVLKAKHQLEKIKNITKEKMGAEHAAIFEAHLMILEDPEMNYTVKEKIKKEKISAAFALQETRNIFVEMFQAMNDEYMRERATDVRDVTDRILKILLNMDIVDLTILNEEVILVAKDLVPSDVATMDNRKVLGLLTDVGGKTSHTAIMARTLEIPAIVGLGDITQKIKNGQKIVFDGKESIVYLNPTKEIIGEYEQKRKEYLKNKIELKKMILEKSITKDGRSVEILANIGMSKDLKRVLENGADGVGLYRTEFLYMHSDSLPTEQQQFEVYKAVLEKIQNKPVVIRTLDIGGDKETKAITLPEERNPFLGYRAIRICLEEKELFKTQLRALLRASIYGDLRIMFPMISSIEEVKAAKEILEEVKGELKEENEKYNESILLGIMIEVPVAAMISDLLAKEVDFFSIGTNDLIQYSIAVDRMNEKIAHLYNPFHPGILRMIKMVIDNAHKEGKKVGMCGEMAGDLRYIPILLGLGLDEFSMSAISILPARKLIKGLSFEKMKEVAEKVLYMNTSQEISEHLENIYTQLK